VIDRVEARFDVSIDHPLVVSRRGGQLVDLGDRVLRPVPRAEAVRAWLEVRLENRFQDQFQSRLRDRSRMVGMPSRRSLPPDLGIIRSRTGSGVNLPDFRSARRSVRNSSIPRTSSM
jgi:hypothetical protein